MQDGVIESQKRSRYVLDLDLIEKIAHLDQKSYSGFSLPTRKEFRSATKAIGVYPSVATSKVDL